MIREYLQSFSWLIYSIQICNNSILPPGGNGGRECILACYSSLGCHMNKRRCGCYSQIQYVIYQIECRPVKNVPHSLRQYDKKHRYLSGRGSSLFLHVTRQFKSIRNLVNICRISGLRICVIYGLISTPSFSDDNTRKRDDVLMSHRRFWRYWSPSRWMNILWKVCSLQFRGLSHISRKLFVQIYYTLWIQSWLAVFAPRNASLRIAFSVPFSKRSRYLTAKPHALCTIGQRPNSAFTAFLLACLSTFSVLLQKYWCTFSISVSFLSW